jgi:hypothetical protein
LFASAISVAKVSATPPRMATESRIVEKLID